MRRKALDELTEKLSAPPKRESIAVDIPNVTVHVPAAVPQIRAFFRGCNIPDAFKRCELVFVPLFSDPQTIANLKNSGFNIGVTVPRVIFGRENSVSKRLGELLQLGIKDVYCGNIGTAALAVRLGMTVHGGFSLNVFNTQSVSFFENMGLADTEVSIELTSRQINSLGGTIKRGIVGYGYLPLMITRNCPNRNGLGCKKCGSISKITDRKGVSFTLMCENKQYTELLNSEPLMLCDKLGDFKSIDFISLMFTTESADETKAILHLYEKGGKPNGKFTRGLYYRGVL